MKAPLGKSKNKTEALEEEEILKRILELFRGLEEDTQDKLLSTLLRKANHETEVITENKR